MDKPRTDDRLLSRQQFTNVDLECLLNFFKFVDEAFLLLLSSGEKPGNFGRGNLDHLTLKALIGCVPVLLVSSVFFGAKYQTSQEIHGVGLL